MPAPNGSRVASGVPLLAGALAAIDCEVEDIVERHSHAIVIGRVLDLQLSPRTAALAYWQGHMSRSIRTRMRSGSCVSQIDDDIADRL